MKRERERERENIHDHNKTGENKVGAENSGGRPRPAQPTAFFGEAGDGGPSDDLLGLHATLTLTQRRLSIV